MKELSIQNKTKAGDTKEFCRIPLVIIDTNLTAGLTLKCRDYKLYSTCNVSFEYFKNASSPLHTRWVDKMILKHQHHGLTQ